MKYIKLFEDLKNYTEISSDEYDLKTSGYDYNTNEQERDYPIKNWENFTDPEIQEVENLLVSNNNYRFYVSSHNAIAETHYRNVAGNIRGRIDIEGYPSDYDNGHSISITVVKLKDEWYYIYGEDGEKYYKCDQFDGLINCLKSII